MNRNIRWTRGNHKIEKPSVGWHWQLAASDGKAERTLAAKLPVPPAALLLGLLLIGAMAGDWPAAGREIYVPTPRGEGETLDSSPAAVGGAAGPEKVITRAGEQLVGRIVGIAGERVRLVGPQFDGEVKVLLPGIEQVTMMPDDLPAGRDAVLIGNGDSITGEVTSMADDAVTVASDAAGPIRIPRRVVSAIGFGKAAGVLVESDFTRGMEPWKSIRGNWQVKDGALVNENQGDVYVVAAPVEQDGPVTLEASVQMSPNWSLECYLVLCSDGKHDNPNSNYWGSRCVNVYFRSGEYTVFVQNNGSQNQVAAGQLKSFNGGEAAVLRVGYDPEAKKIKLWCNSALVGEHDVPNGPASGKFVEFSSQYPCKVKYLRATAGFSTPGEASGPAKGDDDTVQFANKDAISVKSIRLADGKFTLRTTFGELSSTVDKVDRVTFNGKKVERPKRQKGDVLVQTKSSRLTLQLESLTAESLTGTSDYLGPVTIKRSAVKSIRFNLYDTGVSGSAVIPGEADNGPARAIPRRMPVR